jgi:hypothetical protein
MSDTNEDTLIGELACALVNALFKAHSPAKRACIMNALEDILASAETPPHRGRPRRRSRKVNGPQAEPVGPHPDL